MNAGLTIGRLARRAGVNVETIRYYERRGLMPAALRSGAGYRFYGEDSLERLRFITGAKEVGFSLSQILGLLALRSDGRLPAAEVKQLAQSKLAEVEGKIRDLQRMKAVLAGLLASCEGGAAASTSDCPILEALGAEAESCSE